MNIFPRPGVVNQVRPTIEDGFVIEFLTVYYSGRSSAGNNNFSGTFPANLSPGGKRVAKNFNNINNQSGGRATFGVFLFP
jgi:hypothetical protein